MSLTGLVGSGFTGPVPVAPGATEAGISRLFGGDNVVQFGPSSALPHGASTERALAADEAVLIDAWDKPEGYYYDITRSTFFGSPSDEYRKVWEIVLEAQGAAIADGADRARSGEAIDHAGDGGVDLAGFHDFVADHAADLRIALDATLVHNRLAREAVADEA